MRVNWLPAARAFTKLDKKGRVFDNRVESIPKFPGNNVV